MDVKEWEREKAYVAHVKPIPKEQKFHIWNNHMKREIDKWKKSYKGNRSFDALDEHGAALILSRLVAVVPPNAFPLQAAESTATTHFLKLSWGRTKRQKPREAQT